MELAKRLALFVVTRNGADRSQSFDTFRARISLRSSSNVAACSRLFDLEKGRRAMATTYREVAMEQMLGTVEEAMHQVIDWWADLPPPMKEAIEQFRIQLGAAIDSVEFVKRALDRQVHETNHEKGPA